MGKKKRSSGSKRAASRKAAKPKKHKATKPAKRKSVSKKRSPEDTVDAVLTSVFGFLAGLSKL